MKGKKHRPEQIIRKLREAEMMLAAGKTIGQVAQALSSSAQTFHRWRNQSGGMKAEEAKRLKHLEEENKRLKKLVADLTLDKDILEEVLEGNFCARRGVVSWSRTSSRERTCRNVGPVRSLVSRGARSVTRPRQTRGKNSGSWRGCTRWC